MKNVYSHQPTFISKDYPIGSRLELVIMTNPNQSALTPGIKGTVVQVDENGTIHVSWDCKTLSGVVYEEDTLRIVCAE